MFGSNDLPSQREGCAMLAVAVLVVFIAGFVAGRVYEKSGVWWRMPVGIGGKP